MNWSIPLAVALVLLVAFWELYICEGAHLGRRFVVWMYDLSARRYDRIKSFDIDWERRFLGEPVYQVIQSMGAARLLDVGAGTGRLVRALEAAEGQPRPLIAVEPSRKMIEAAKGDHDQTCWVQSWSVPLPFPEGAFDFVSSLEILEFTPAPQDTLKELIRVLRPGGWLLVTNRVGWQAPLILGKTFSREQFPKTLRSLGLTEVEVFPWQMDYDLAWARKSWKPWRS